MICKEKTLNGLELGLTKVNKPNSFKNGIKMILCMDNLD
jgi:hypothetical protein